MSPQDFANRMLKVWQANRDAPPEQRMREIDKDLRRDMTVIRAVLERRS